MSAAKRPYRQTARAAATEELRHRIAVAFHGLLAVRWIDEIALDDVAASAGTTRQTVIRLFGGKAGLLEAVIAFVREPAVPRFALPHGASRQTAIAALMADYEATGDMTARLLAQEQRHPALRPPLDQGRRIHRDWVAEQFGAALTGLNDQERERQITRLVVATDLYTWKLLRRDLGSTREEATILIAGIVNSIMGEGNR